MLIANVATKMLARASSDPYHRPTNLPRVLSSPGILSSHTFGRKRKPSGWAAEGAEQCSPIAAEKFRDQQMFVQHQLEVTHRYHTIISNII